MERILIKVTYRITLDRKAFAKYLLEETSVQVLQKSTEKSLYDKLITTHGVRDVNYDGHFGPYVWITVEALADDARTWGKITKILLKYNLIKE